MRRAIKLDRERKFKRQSIVKDVWWEMHYQLPCGGGGTDKKKTSVFFFLWSVGLKIKT